MTRSANRVPITASSQRIQTVIFNPSISEEQVKTTKKRKSYASKGKAYDALNDLKVDTTVTSKISQAYSPAKRNSSKKNKLFSSQ